MVGSEGRVWFVLFVKIKAAVAIIKLSVRVDFASTVITNVTVVKIT